MSSTNRGTPRQAQDYYVTPIPPILEFLSAFYEDTGFRPKLILDPCAGGDADHPMSYPSALEKFESWSGCELGTIDIREDSLAENKFDYLKHKVACSPDLIISNPPFYLACEFILKGIADVADNGHVVMLGRLNFFGSDDRKEFWHQHMPEFTYVHSHRLAFTTKKSAELANLDAQARGKPQKPWKPGQTDSIEYAHFCWRKGHNPKFTNLRII